MDFYENAGVTQLNMYDKAIKDRKPETRMVEAESDINEENKNKVFLNVRSCDKYTVDDKKMMVTDSPSLELLLNFKSDELGFDIKSPAAFVVETSVHLKGNGGSLINRGTYDEGGRFIVYQDAFKEADTAKKVPLNEMGMQNFLNAANPKSQKSQNFKTAFLMDVQNKEFWEITRQNYNDLKQPFSQVLTFRRGTPQFNRYMGSPNFNSKFYSFANHHDSIGNKIPTSIVVIPKQVENPKKGIDYKPGDPKPQTPTIGKLMAAVVFKDP
ncbi:hypothetical protein QQS21_005381 [Conoideocrella luteorostrata]|uniref:Uncharacterized protein n=1 Tax=Conoideocrella luteorostrata TaxID=1105319 RepID=A0AAJ0FZ53_9HYPO|nr:hypothetical protein QQS21_005381 [Conoideocrella luteorostrata]